MPTPYSLVLALGLGSAVGLGSTPPSQESGPAIELEGRDGSVRSLALSELSTDDPRKLGALLVRPRGLPPWKAERVTSEEVRMRLASGDELRGSITGGEGERLSIELLPDVVLPIEVSELASVVFPARIPADPREPVEAPEEGDRLYQRIGDTLDRIDGTLEGFSDEGIRFDGLVGRHTYPWAQVAALYVEFLGSDGGAASDEGGAPVVVDLRDGSRVRGRLAGLERTGCRLLIGTQSEITLPLEAVAEVVVNDGSVAFLSQLEPEGEEGRGTPFGDDLGMTWPFRVDREARDGKLLHAGGRVYTRGIGAHAPSRITWRLDGWSKLRGLVAVDDGVLGDPARGSVVFRIVVDGEPVWESGIIRGGDPPVRFPDVDLSGAKTLALESDMADELHQGDRADWLRMTLFR